jgi:guanylate kinase
MTDKRTRAANPGLLLVISGPSGVGKTTIAREVEGRLGGLFSVSVTTRPKTPGDVEGRDYHFISEQEFAARRDAGDLLEWAQVFGTHMYGTPRKPVEEALGAGRLMILEIDVQGGVQVKRRIPDAYMVFVMPPSDEHLLKRLRGRGRDSEAAIQRRFAEAKREIQTAKASGAYQEFVINDVLERAVERVCELVNRQRGAAARSN